MKDESMIKIGLFGSGHCRVKAVLVPTGFHWQNTYDSTSMKLINITEIVVTILRTFHYLMCIMYDCVCYNSM